MVRGQSSKKGRTRQRPLEWKIPIFLLASAERLEWNPAHRGASEGLVSGEEEAGAAEFPKKFDSERKVREKCRQIKGENSVRKRVPKCLMLKRWWWLKERLKKM